MFRGIIFRRPHQGGRWSGFAAHRSCVDDAGDRFAHCCTSVGFPNPRHQFFPSYSGGIRAFSYPNTGHLWYLHVYLHSLELHILANVDTSALIIMTLGTVITVYALVNLFAFHVTVSQKHKFWLCLSLEQRQD